MRGQNNDHMNRKTNKKHCNLWTESGKSDKKLKNTVFVCLKQLLKHSKQKKCYNIFFFTQKNYLYIVLNIDIL